MVIPTVFLTANPFSQTDAAVQGNLRECEQKLADVPEQQKLTNVYSIAGFLQNIETGHIFI